MYRWETVKTIFTVPDSNERAGNETTSTALEREEID
jgi:hypothetical protein